MCSNSKWVIEPREFYGNALFRSKIKGTICCKSEIMANTRLVNVARSRPETTMWLDPGSRSTQSSPIIYAPLKLLDESGWTPGAFRGEFKR